jgi:hypothetical protein
MVQWRSSLVHFDRNRLSLSVVVELITVRDIRIRDPAIHGTDVHTETVHTLRTILG